MISLAPFVRRTNPDSTQDSICTTCFLTVCLESVSESELLAAEQRHNCNRAIQAECTHYHLNYAEIEHTSGVVPVDQWC